MSQPRQYENDELDPNFHPVTSKQDLIDVFAKAIRKKGERKVGVEFERFGYLDDQLKPLPYEGEKSLETIFFVLEKTGFSPVLESGQVIALTSKEGAITIEPGGQFEWSGAPVKTIQESYRQISNFVNQVEEISRRIGVGFLGIGFHPTAKWEEMPVVPKQRYEIMNRYMPTVGRRGVDMMKRTCTVQANLDFTSEEDMREMFQVALSVSPVVAGLFASSPFYEGKLTKVLSERAVVWFDTDSSRSGFPEIALKEDFCFEKWVDFVLNVPMYFIRRGGRHIDCAGASMRNFWLHGMHGYHFVLRDFIDHLTTVFTEVRIKPYMEMRSADCGPLKHVFALPALWKGILYDETAREHVKQLMQAPKIEELAALQASVSIEGFSALYRGQPILPLMIRLLEIAQNGLQRLAKAGGHEDESIYLSPLFHLVQQGSSYAQILRERYIKNPPKKLTAYWFLDIEEKVYRDINLA